jgi:hypothetical protein
MTILRLCDGCSTRIPHDQPLCDECEPDAFRFPVGSVPLNVVGNDEEAALVLKLNSQTLVVIDLDPEDVNGLYHRFDYLDRKLNPEYQR